jgi:hypothetical protein
MPNRRNVSAITFIGVWLACTVAFAQSVSESRNATAKEIEGNWQLLPLPDAVEPRLLKANPWPAPCQWYSYSPTGDLKSIEAAKLPCDPLTTKQLDETFRRVPAVVFWKYDLSPVYQKGLLLVTRSDVKGYGEIWDPQIAAKPFTNNGVEFREGDLILYLVDMSTHQFSWIRHLRKVK